MTKVDIVLMTTTRRLYYDPAGQSAFSTPRKLRSTTTSARKGTSTGKKSIDAIRAGLEKLDAYTFQRPARKCFASNTYSVTNVMDVWECDLKDVQAYAKYYDIHIYIVTVIDLFSKLLHMVPVKTKSGPSIASTFRSIFENPKYSRRKNKHFQDMLREKSVQFQVFKNHDFKCDVEERVHRTISDTLYK